MEPEKKNQMEKLSKKFNLEAMQAYNFDNVNLDFKFDDIDEKKHQEIINQAEKLEKEIKDKEEKEKK